MTIIGPVSCRDCDVLMTQEDIEFYEYRCLECEREWMIRVEEWRHGAEDAEIDAAFGNYAQYQRSVH